MIDRIIDFSARNRLLVVALTAAAAIAGWISITRAPLDAVPDLGDTQVIIYTRWDRSPDLVEDQITYPIVTAMVGAPRVKAVRGISDFGYSYVYVIFEDGTDLYWARSRTLEYLSSVQSQLPEGAKTQIGPDATGLGWIYQYALVDRSGARGLADLRSLQDFFLRYHLKAIPGVAEVAPVGGFNAEWQINVDPNRLLAFGIPIQRVAAAVRAGNSEVGGRLLELGGSEYMIRGRGYAHGAADLEDIVLAAHDDGSAIRVRDVGEVVRGPDLRRGLAELDGTGEVVSGIVVMREGANALDVIERVKKKLAELRPGLPGGVEIIPIYDRSDLIRRAIDNLQSTIVEVIVTVALVIFLFLWHPPSAAIPVLTIPLTVLIAFIPFGAAGLTANIMSLGGIAIAIGALVDAAIVVVEQTHKKLEERARSSGEGGIGDEREVIISAIKEVAGPSFFALLVIGASFLPILALEAEEGRLFRPLALTKTLCMVVAALLTITLDPALRLLLTRTRPIPIRAPLLRRAVNALLVGRVHAEERHPVSRALVRLYAPVVAWSLRNRALVIGGALASVLVTMPVFHRLGAEFMPPLDEGTLLYMPSTMPGISIGEAQKLLQMTDRIIETFPEVDHVLGKAGRADTPTDPAPLSMLETVITLKPRSQWRAKHTWYSDWAPELIKPVLRRITSDRISEEELIAEMNAALKLPGVSNAWTMPIKGRIDMLSTGLRTPIGIKITGGDPAQIDAVGARVQSILKDVPGTRSVYAERSGGGRYLDLDWDRAALAREGLSVDETQAAVASAIGGEDVTTTIDGRERHPVNVRYLRDFRSDPAALARVLVAVEGGKRQVPLGEIARLSTRGGPAMLRDENGLLTGYVYLDVAGLDPRRYIAAADGALRTQLQLPPGCTLVWSGQFEAMERAAKRLGLIVPATLFLVVLLLYLNARSLAKTLIVLLAVPFSAVGAVWLLYALGYNLSVGVWVGLVALLGVDAETGIFMLLYLDLAYERARRDGRMRSRADLHEAILAGAARRIRPKFMTAATMFMGLVPIMWSTGTGADVMKRIAAPMIGGIFTSFVLELVVYPAIYEVWKWRAEVRRAGAPVEEAAA